MDERPAPDVAGQAERKGRSPRDRILEVSAELFGRRGIQAVGIDGIIDRAEVAKATLYKQFRSKDELILAWLRGPNARWMDWVIEEVERRTDVPFERLIVIFDVLEEWFERDDFSGCAFQNTSAEVRATDEPIRAEIRSYIQEVKEWLQRSIKAADVPDAGELAEQLRLLVSGSIWIAFMTGSSRPAATARASAMELLASARSTGPRGAKAT